MEERIRQKLLELGYDAERREEANDKNLIAISRGFLEGLVLFEGDIIYRDGKIRVVLRDEENAITISGSRTENSNSLYGDFFQRTLGKDTVIDPRSGYFSSLYVTPLYRRFREEGVCLDFIIPSDRIYVDGIRNGLFTLVFEDVRKNCFATFEFQKKGEMLYIPKQSNS